MVLTALMAQSPSNPKLWRKSTAGTDPVFEETVEKLRQAQLKKRGDTSIRGAGPLIGESPRFVFLNYQFP